MSTDKSFDQLVDDGLALSFSGWDFSAIGERWTSSYPSWDFAGLAREHFAGVRRLLDMDTGGGEFLAWLLPLPAEIFATEGYPPNIEAARQRLEPLGVQVISEYTDESLPFSVDYFDLVLNRHGSFHAKELYRILRPGGIFLTQQVGGDNNIRLNELLQDKVSYKYSHFSLDYVVHWLREAGLRILQAREEHPPEVFYDVGAVVYYLRIISWQIADFSVEKYQDKLYAVHTLIQRDGKLVTYGHRILVEALKE